MREVRTGHGGRLGLITPRPGCRRRRCLGRHSVRLSGTTRGALSTDTEIDNSGHRAPHSAQTTRDQIGHGQVRPEASGDILQVELGSMEACRLPQLMVRLCPIRILSAMVPTWVGRVVMNFPNE
jgi:hypothetical protein